MEPKTDQQQDHYLVKTYDVENSKSKNLLKTVRLRDLLKYYLKLMSEGVDRYQCKFEIQMFRLRSSLDYDLR